ncbi:MAG: carbonic anhydrase [Komarekiella atlantica HA4396-MV6]|nr:carbonic anhydrase [Komarekiella atlantica HA4396-MV6]
MSGKQSQVNISRRNLLQFSAGAIATGVVTAGVGSNLIVPKPALAKDDNNPEKGLQLLLEGNDRFVKRKRKNPNQGYSRLQEVAKGQKPFASILGCADSRVPSEIIFDQGLGDLFVCRIAGNVATPEEIGSLEFGSLVLGTTVIMVVGHERCGAIEAAIKGAQVPGQIGSLIDAIKPAVEKSQGQPGDKVANACKSNVLVQIDKLKASPVLAELIKANKLKIVGGYYDLDTGRVSIVS